MMRGVYEIRVWLKLVGSERRVDGAEGITLVTLKYADGRAARNERTLLRGYQLDL